MNKKQAFKDTLKATAIVAWAFISIGMILIGADQDPTYDANGNFEPFSGLFFLGLLSGLLCIPYAKQMLDEDEERRKHSPYNTSGEDRE